MSSAARKLSSKVALITGSSSGIGKATALLFSQLGARLSLTGRNLEAIQELKNRCLTKHSSYQTDDTILVTKCELTSEPDVQQLVRQTVAHFGRLDILVNSAGIIEFGSVENTSLEQFDRVMGINLRSVYQLMTLSAEHLVATKGNVVNVSSVNGVRSFPNVLAYCVAKAGVDQLTRCAAIELAGKHVRVNAVNPGVITTGLQKRGGLTEQAFRKFLEHSRTTHALGRPGEAPEVAAAIAFLASDEASFITGVTLPVDGGRHALCPR
ncbi:unnamed protein product [Medioppia subpectinata]|uniref:Ketoreductase domain-containing protein n=1 Tax=Medioppia subpectinata TaxID=1979941 RepID=A0A7R9Q1N5_9ACAR|nr:unnamed protein product [Medioppia subpectinata]CAG2109430.1 unnamed protein product [Medioppia subpectinata]